MKAPEVRIEKVVKRFRRIYALKGVDLTARSGAITVVLGPPGAGKTTLLRVIAGLEEPDSGRVLFDGRDVTKLPPSARNVGLVFQSFALYPHMTVYDNIASPLKAQGLPESDVRKRVEDVAAMLRISDILNKRPYEISGGQRQRVAIARALVKDASVYLFDEPLTNLDYKIREAMRGELRKILRERGGTMIWATPDPQEALALGDYVAVLYDGRVLQYGPTYDVYNRPANPVVAKSFSYPPTNILDATVRKEEGRVLLDLGFAQFDATEINVTAKLESGQEVLVGIRPIELKPCEGVAEGHTMSGEVIISEVVGSETFIHVSVGGKRVISHVHGIVRFEPGYRVKLCLGYGRFFIFDKKSGELIYTPYG